MTEQEIRCSICNTPLTEGEWLEPDPGDYICPREDFVACYYRAEAEWERKQKRVKV